VPFATIVYTSADRIARISLNRPGVGNALTLDTPAEIAEAVERANLDPSVSVIALDGRGSGFCSGYDLSVISAPGESSHGSPLEPAVQRANHDPGQPWDPTIDFAMMQRNARGFMSLFHSEKPVVTKIHGFCVGGGTDLALCSDLILIEETAKFGYPPARVWGVPTTALWVARIGIEKAKRLLFTGDCVSGTEAAAWGLALEAVSASELDARFEALLHRIAKMPVNQLILMKMLLNYTLVAQGLFNNQLLGVILDGLSRHTPEGYAFMERVRARGVADAIRERDAPFEDAGRSTFKG
jgi:enoyl-CoA hydratase